MRGLFIMTSFVALVCPALSRAQSAADSASVTAFYGAWFGSMRQGPESYASFYAIDGMVLPPNAAPAIGRAAVAEWLRQSQATTPFVVRPEAIALDEMRFLTAEWVLYRSTLRGQRIPKPGEMACRLKQNMSICCIAQRKGAGR